MRLRSLQVACFLNLRRLVSRTSRLGARLGRLLLAEQPRRASRLLLVVAVGRGARRLLLFVADAVVSGHRRAHVFVAMFGLTILQLLAASVLEHLGDQVHLARGRVARGSLAERPSQGARDADSLAVLGGAQLHQLVQGLRARQWRQHLARGLLGGARLRTLGLVLARHGIGEARRVGKPLELGHFLGRKALLVRVTGGRSGRRPDHRLHEINVVLLVAGQPVVMMVQGATVAVVLLAVDDPNRVVLRQLDVVVQR